MTSGKKRAGARRPRRGVLVVAAAVATVALAVLVGLLVVPRGGTTAAPAPSATPAATVPPSAATGGAPPPGTLPDEYVTGSGEVSAPPPDEAARVEAARRAALRDGVIAYRPPSPMRQGDRQRIVVRAAGVAERGQLLAGLSGVPGSVTEKSIPVGLTLHAELVGDGFDVTSLDGTGSAFRPTLPGDVAEWQWDIEPTESGPKTLTLLVRSFYGDLSSPVALRYLDEPVQVDYDPVYSVGALLSSPGWTATGITVPVVAGLVVALARRRRRTGQTTETPVGQPGAVDEATGSPPSARGYL